MAELPVRTRLVFVFWGTLMSSCLFFYECRKLTGYKFPVYSTEFCPGNQTEWNKRSSAINCSENNGYLCFPNENFTQLVEFCYTFPFIWIQEGFCLYLDKRSSIYSYSCSRFQFGCHNSSYASYKQFEYPSCTSIGNGCFLAEPSCKGNSSAAATTTFPPGSKEETHKKSVLVFAIYGGITFLVVISLLFVYHKRGCFCIQKNNGGYSTEKPRSQNNGILTKVNFTNRCDRIANLFWFDFNGELVRYAILKKGQCHKMDTYIKHPWCAMEEETNDRLVVDKQFVFYPKEGQGDKHQVVYIDIPGKVHTDKTSPNIDPKKLDKPHKLAAKKTVSYTDYKGLHQT